MKKYLFSFLSVVFLAGFNMLDAAQIKIAASLPDLASIASYIGGDKVETFSIARGNANSHYIEVLPSYMIRVSRANVYLKVGLALDQWADDIIQGSRNGKLTVVDCSGDIPVLEKPTKADSILGDVHSQGNPHYWLNPANGIIIANNILNALIKIDPENGEYYRSNFNRFKQETENRLINWKDKMSRIEVKKLIGYHSSWVYFADAFGLTISGYIEPLPGIPPTGKHLSELINIIKSNDIKILLQEPYFPDDGPKFLYRQTGIKPFKVAPSCIGTGKDEYFRHFDEVINKITS